MARKPRIYAVELSPNPVEAGKSFILSVTIVTNYYLHKHYTHAQLRQFTHGQLRDMGSQETTEE